MSEEVFVIRNQLGQFWTRSSEWVDGREPQRVLKLKHRDEAVNQLVELSAKDVELRGEILYCETSSKNEPVLQPSEHKTPTLAEQAAERSAAAAQVAAEEAEEAETGNDAREPREPSEEATV